MCTVPWDLQNKLKSINLALPGAKRRSQKCRHGSVLHTRQTDELFRREAFPRPFVQWVISRVFQSYTGQIFPIFKHVFCHQLQTLLQEDLGRVWASHSGRPGPRTLVARTTQRLPSQCFTRHDSLSFACRYRHLLQSAMAGVPESDRCPGWSKGLCPNAPPGTLPQDQQGGCSVM